MRGPIRVRLGRSRLSDETGIGQCAATGRGWGRPALAAAVAAAPPLRPHPPASPTSRLSSGFCMQAAVAGNGPIIVTEKELMLPGTPKYCESINQTRRRPTRTINVSRSVSPS